MKNIVTNVDSRSPLAEAVKTLRTNLQFMQPSEGLQTVLITSTLPSEGKSWVTSNLAVAFAQTGKKTVIVDADMRKGTMHYLFDLPLTPGLSNYLSGVNLKKNSSISSVLQETEVENLYVITAGDIPPNPSELLLSEKIDKLFKELEKIADIVIFDGTPSLLVTDAMILSRKVNSTIIIAEYNRTKTNNLKQVKEEIEKVGGKVAGVVLNKVPTKGKGYGYGYSYGYSYRYGYDYEYNDLPTVKSDNKVIAFFQKLIEKIKKLMKELSIKLKEYKKNRLEKKQANKLKKQEAEKAKAIEKIQKIKSQINL